MDCVNKTLYIPLYGKAYVSRRGLFLEDPMAERIWGAEGFPLKGKSASKWLACYMGIRSAVFDDWTRQQLADHPDGVVLHLGCGLDSRCLRAGDGKRRWYDVDFPDVIAERKRYFSESDDYRMICADVRDPNWLEALPETGTAIVVMEGISMYLAPEELNRLMAGLCGHFRRILCLMDCYSTMAAKLSRYKNPINDVGVTQVYGMDDPTALKAGGFRFIREHEMTPEKYIGELKGMEKAVFSRLFAGSFSKSLYRMFEYRNG